MIHRTIVTLDQFIEFTERGVRFCIPYINHGVMRSENHVLWSDWQIARQHDGESYILTDGTPFDLVAARYF
jgi:hypothetical protein